MAAAKTKRIALSETDALFLPALVISLLTLFGWGAYVLSFGVPKRSAALLLFVLLLALWLVLAVSAAGTPAAVLVAFRQGLLPQVSRPWVALTGLIVLAGIIYRLASWPHLIVVPGGDGAGYDYMAATAATLHRFVLLVYRTPGYPFLLFWTYLISGVHNYVAVYAVQLVLAALTGILMMAAVLVATGRRFAALLALLIGMLWHPMAAASAYLMSELPAIFLSALTIALLVSLLSHRHVASSSLALGPSLALLYEVRPTMVLWALAAGLAALLLPYLRWRHRALLLGGAATILVPIALVNYASPYRALTPGTALELTAAVLGSDRFSLYLNAPNSPRLMEALYDSTITDGGGVDVWSDKPPAEWPSITRQRQSIIVGYIAKHLGETLQVGRHGRHFCVTGRQPGQPHRRARVHVQRDSNLARHEALRLELGAEPTLHEQREAGRVLPERDLLPGGFREPIGVDLEEHRGRDLETLGVEHDPHVGDRADLRPLERDRRADGDALHRALEVRNRRLGQPEEPPAAEDDEADDRQRQPAHDERSDESGIGPSSHAASLRPTRRG